MTADVAGADEPSWSVDGDLYGPGWSDEVTAALRLLHQGRLVADPPTVYYASALRPLTVTTQRWAQRRAPDDSSGPVTPRKARPPWGIITTQTCDLIEDGRPKPKRPWFMLAPVYWYRCDTDVRAVIEGGLGFGYLFAVTTLGSPPGGLWVADLRLEIPVEKGWLVGKRTQPAFARQVEYLCFAERLGNLRMRFAYPRDLDTLFLAPCLEKLTLVARRLGMTFEPRYEAGKDRDDPDTVRLVLISDHQAPRDVQDEMQQWWVETFQQDPLPGLNVLPPWLVRYQDLDPRDYELLMRFDVLSLGNRRTG